MSYSESKYTNELDVASTLDGTEISPIFQDGLTKQTTTQDIANLAGSISGTVNHIPRFTPNGTTLGDSLLQDLGGVIRGNLAITTGDGIEFTTNTITTGSLLRLEAGGNDIDGGKILVVDTTGSNTLDGKTGYAIYSRAANSGTNSTNIAGYFAATTGTNNYALIIPPNSGNMGVGTITPDSCSIIDITSTTQGLLLPRMTKVQRNAISSPIAGLAVFQTDNTPGLRVYNGTNWMKYTETID